MITYTHRGLQKEEVKITNSLSKITHGTKASLKLIFKGSVLWEYNLIHKSPLLILHEGNEYYWIHHAIHQRILKKSQQPIYTQPKNHFKFNI